MGLLSRIGFAHEEYKTEVPEEDIVRVLTELGFKMKKFSSGAMGVHNSFKGKNSILNVDLLPLPTGVIQVRFFWNRYSDHIKWRDLDDVMRKIEDTVLEEKKPKTKPVAKKAKSIVKPKVKEGSFCPKCGAKLRPEDNFCPNCGAKI